MSFVAEMQAIRKERVNLCASKLDGGTGPAGNLFCWKGGRCDRNFALDGLLDRGGDGKPAQQL
jgi:hypothetical protein